MIAAVGQRAALVPCRHDKRPGEVREIQPINSRPAIEKVLTVADQYREGPATGRRQGKLLGRLGAMVDPAVGDQHAVRSIYPQPRVKVVGGGQRPTAYHYTTLFRSRERPLVQIA